MGILETALGNSRDKYLHSFRFYNLKFHKNQLNIFGIQDCLYLFQGKQLVRYIIKEGKSVSRKCRQEN